MRAAEVDVDAGSRVWWGNEVVAGPKCLLDCISALMVMVKISHRKLSALDQLNHSP